MRTRPIGASPVDDSPARNSPAGGSLSGASLTSGPTISVPPVGIVARGWGWRHSGRAAWAVRHVDFVIEPGERLLLLGASGAGKSTLVQAIAGLLGGVDDGDDEGELLVGGRPAPQARGTVGLVLQDPDSHAVMARVGDDVAFGCENLGVSRDEIWSRVAESLASVGLDVPLDASTSALSGGQKQRLALAGILAMRPGLVVLDEPTANLDPAGVIEVRDAVDRMLRLTGATLVVIEHRVAVWRDLVTRVIVLGDSDSDGHGDGDGGGDADDDGDGLGRGGAAVIADGAPDEVLGVQGAALAAAGVWVPGFLPRLPVRSKSWGAPLLGLHDLAIGRSAGDVLHSGLDGRVIAGKCLAITGPNGARKSTLGLTLGGLLRPRSGEVDAAALLATDIWDGRSEGGGRDNGPGFRRRLRWRDRWPGARRPSRSIRSPHPIDWTSRELVSRIGSVFQDPEHQFVASTVRGELEVGTSAIGLDPTEAAARIAPLLQRLRLDGLQNANPFTLSGGEKRRLSVATALVTRPAVLVLDEPTFGQDQRTWGELVAFLAELLDAGSAVVIVTHDLDLVAALADDEFRMAAPE